MAKTVKEAFDAYRSNLELTDIQANLVYQRRDRVINIIEQKISLHPDRVLLTGSWHRHTMTRFLSEADVDIMVIMHYGDNKQWNSDSGTITALNKFREVLSETLTTTTMRRDRNAITLSYPEFRLDVVPCFYNSDGYYRIPDSIRQKWVKTNPSEFSKRVTQVNKTMGGTYIPLVKMIKGWNREVGWPIRSFHLECMMLNRYSSYSQGYTYSSMVKVFFESLPGMLRQATFDPVMGDRVDTYLDEGTTRTRNQAINKATSAAEKSASAFLDEEKYPVTSIQAWKELMGVFFPAYG